MSLANQANSVVTREPAPIPFLEHASNEDPKILAIVPARGGSKGLPRKNIRNLCGKPLIAYSIEAALRTKRIHHVVVSTEDEEISEISRSYGAEVPFLRPKEMAQDRSSIGDAYRYTVDRLKNDGYRFNVTVTLYPTHLFRTPKLMDFLAGKLLEGYSAVRTVNRASHHRLPFLSRNGTRQIVPWNWQHSPDGSVHKPYFIFHGLFLGDKRNDCSPFKLYPDVLKHYYHVISDPIALIDIDTLSDFYMAEEIIKEGLFDFGQTE